MMLLDGKRVADEIIENVRQKVIDKNLDLKLAIIWVGNNVSSEIYIKNKIKKCDYVGIKTELFHLDESSKENEVLKLIDELNKRNDINGIILQSPTPKHIDEIKCFNAIDYKKDIDGFSNASVGDNYHGNPYYMSCTPKGIIRLLDYYNIPIEGSHVVIINRSNIVGKPLLHLLLSRNATVTVCHSKTKDIETITKTADILVSAVGIPNFIKKNMVKRNAVVIDVGISRVDGKVVGDVDFKRVSRKASYITPVPKGVGPMTIAMILENMVEKR